MTIKISQYTKFQTKLEKLIKKGRDLYKAAYKQEEINNKDDYYGLYPSAKEMEELVTSPESWSETNFAILVWKKQCHHCLLHIGIYENPSYRDVYSVLEGTSIN